MILTSNLTFGSWDSAFADDSINGESFRLKDKCNQDYSLGHGKSPIRMFCHASRAHSRLNGVTPQQAYLLWGV
jgi:hypothetical protein